jgi:excisionase family DNA binding protein
MDQARQPADPSLLITDAAVLLGVSRRTVYYWIRQRRLETVRTRGGSQRVLLSSIARRLRLDRGLPPLEDLPTASAGEPLQPEALPFQVEALPGDAE